MDPKASGIALHPGSCSLVRPGSQRSSTGRYNIEHELTRWMDCASTPVHGGRGVMTDGSSTALRVEDGLMVHRTRNMG